MVFWYFTKKEIMELNSLNPTMEWNPKFKFHQNPQTKGRKHVTRVKKNLICLIFSIPVVANEVRKLKRLFLFPCYTIQKMISN